LFTAMTGIFTPAYSVSKRTGSDGIPRWHASGQKIQVEVSQEWPERLRASGSVDRDRGPGWCDRPADS
jgi:hypothetical protein